MTRLLLVMLSQDCFRGKDPNRGWLGVVAQRVSAQRHRFANTYHTRKEPQYGTDSAVHEEAISFSHAAEVSQQQPCVTMLAVLL